MFAYRRPGRVRLWNVCLIPLPERPAHVHKGDVLAASSYESGGGHESQRGEDSLAAASGVGLASLLGALLWAILVGAAWLLLKRP
jgi:hypothetical protein